ncbi:hypothetical protein JCM10449v2_003455 [Rhodotorula kratochvilovae]
MTSQATQPCFVCGKKTKSVCSNCRKAGIDVFFCSPGHQKLVWFAHKLVCGPGKANPFIWPDLTQEEADLAKANPHARWPGGLTLIEAFAGDFGTTLELLPSTLDSLVSSPTVPAHELKTRQKMNKLARVYVYHLRDEFMLAAFFRFGIGPSSTRPNIMDEWIGPNNLLIKTAGTLSSICTLFLSDVDKPWLHTFSHRMLIRNALLYLYTAHSSPEIARYVSAVNAQLKTVVATEVMPTHPELAREMLRTLQMEQDLRLTPSRLVCGEKTKSRCSNCKRAGIDLFFCSPEHQKLVWPVHKLVCGPGKANPFRFPKLTAKEAEDAIQHKDVRIHNKITIAELIQKERVPSHKVADEIRSLSELSSSTAVSHPRWDQFNIAHIRYLEHERTFQPEATPGEPEFAHDRMARQLDHDFLLTLDKPVGRTPFLHRVLICCALTYMPRAVAPRALCLTSWDQMQACFDKELKPKNRAEAEKLMHETGGTVEVEFTARVWI